MQDKYSGDIGDFGKYILLRELCNLSQEKIRLGINWYYSTRPEPGNSDGHHIAYLHSASLRAGQFRACAPEVYDTLGNIVAAGTRSLEAIEASHLLPQTTRFYRSPLPTDAPTPSDRLRARNDWFDQSLVALQSTNTVFLDPDNGLAPPTGNKRTLNAIKYAFADEVIRYYASGVSVILYNHRDRSPQTKYVERFALLRDTVYSPADFHVVRFRRVSVRDYVLMSQPHHSLIFSQLCRRLMSPPLDLLFGQSPPL